MFDEEVVYHGIQQSTADTGGEKDRGKPDKNSLPSQRTDGSESKEQPPKEALVSKPGGKGMNDFTHLASSILTAARRKKNKRREFLNIPLTFAKSARIAREAKKLHLDGKELLRINHSVSGLFFTNYTDDLQGNHSPSLLTWASDGNCKLWKAKTGEFLGKLYQGHTRSVVRSHPFDFCPKIEEHRTHHMAKIDEMKAQIERDGGLSAFVPKPKGTVSFAGFGGSETSIKSSMKNLKLMDQNRGQSRGKSKGQSRGGPIRGKNGTIELDPKRHGTRPFNFASMLPELIGKGASKNKLIPAKALQKMRGDWLDEQVIEVYSDSDEEEKEDDEKKKNDQEHEGTDRADSRATPAKQVPDKAKEKSESVGSPTIRPAAKNDSPSSVSPTIRKQRKKPISAIQMQRQTVAGEHVQDISRDLKKGLMAVGGKRAKVPMKAAAIQRAQDLEQKILGSFQADPRASLILAQRSPSKRGDEDTGHTWGDLLSDFVPRGDEDASPDEQQQLGMTKSRSWTSLMPKRQQSDWGIPPPATCELPKLPSPNLSGFPRLRKPATSPSAPQLQNLPSHTSTSTAGASSTTLSSTPSVSHLPTLQSLKKSKKKKSHRKVKRNKKKNHSDVRETNDTSGSEIS